MVRGRVGFPMGSGRFLCPVTAENGCVGQEVCSWGSWLVSRGLQGCGSPIMSVFGPESVSLRCLHRTWTSASSGGALTGLGLQSPASP